MNIILHKLSMTIISINIIIVPSYAQIGTIIENDNEIKIIENNTVSASINYSIKSFNTIRNGGDNVKLYVKYINDEEQDLHIYFNEKYIFVKNFKKFENLFDINRSYLYINNTTKCNDIVFGLYEPFEDTDEGTIAICENGRVNLYFNGRLITESNVETLKPGN